jgi:O-antigen ligase
VTSPVELAERPPIASLRLGRPFPESLVRYGLLGLGVVLGLAIAYLVTTGQLEMAIGVAVAVPIVALLVRNPFAGVVLWVLVVPYFVRLSVDGTAPPAIWAAHRIAIPVCLIIAAMHARMGWRRWGLRFGWIDLAVLGFLALGLANAWLITGNPTRTIIAFYDKLIVPVMIFWLIRALEPRGRELITLMFAGLVTIAVQSTIGILTWVAPSLLPSAWLGRAGERTTGTVGGPGPFTVTLVLFAILAIHVAAESPSVRRRAALLGFGLLAGLAVVLSLSRGSWLGAGVAIAGLAVVHRRLVGVAAIIGFVLLLGLSFGPLADQIAIAQARIGVTDTVESRIITNDAATRMIEARPLMGFGFGNFEKFDEQFKQRVGDIPLKLGGSSHNTYLNMLAELGIPATILYVMTPLALLFLTFRRWRSLPRSGLISRGLVLVLWFAVLDQLVVQNFEEMIHASYWGTALYWMTFGLIATTLSRVERQPPATYR